MTPDHTLPHQHDWDCFRTSGGYTNAMESSTPLPIRIETVYRTAYATGLKNGKREAAEENERLREALKQIVLLEDETNAAGREARAALERTR